MAKNGESTSGSASKPAGPSQPGAGKAAKYAFHKRFAIVFSLILIAFTYFRFFTRFDDAWTDQLFRWRGMEQGDPRITVVTMDDTSLEKVGSYPWPRDVYEKLISKILDAGVQVVGLDILFLDPSDSKLSKSGKWAVGPKDAALIRVTKKVGENLVHAIHIDTRGEQYAKEAVWEFQYPFEPLKEATKSFGIVLQVLISHDGTVRDVPVLIGTEASARERWAADPNREATFGAKILSLFEGKKPEDYVELIGENKVVLNIRGEIPGQVDYEIQPDNSLKPVALPPKYGIPRIGAWRFLEDDLNAAEKARLKGGIVLVGSTATGAFDHYPSAFNHSTPGVESHANFIDNVLNRRWMRHLPEAIAYLSIGLFAALAYWLVSLPALYAGLAFAALFLGWAVLSYVLFLNLQILMFTAPSISLLGTFLVLMVHKTMLEQQQKKEVRQMFGQYVSPEIVDILVKDPDKLKLGGEKRDMTIFFLDIAHFTTISEKMAPENLINFLNHYLTALTDDILESRGVVDKYIGDCIMAFWNAPLEVPGHREKACIAALGCIKTIERLNKEYVDPSMPETPAVRIGLNSGEVVVGNTGSARKLAYTVLGDEVNLSSRLEGANKFFGSTIMASEDTYEGAKNAVVARRLGRVRVVGKETPILVYELLAKKGELSEGWEKALPFYEGAVEKYLKRDYASAKEDFEQVLKHVPGDKPAKLYLSSCEDYLVIPPPENWDGVFNLTSK